MIDAATLEAVEGSDTDRLLRIIDGWCAARSWELLIELRPHLAAAAERGKQLWAVDEHIRYRLALEGPHHLAGAMVDEGPARFTLGPLTEVVAQRRTWADIEPFLGRGPLRGLVAHERSLRHDPIPPGEVDDAVFEIPIAIQDWEPGYPPVEYKSDRAEFPSPVVPGFTWEDLRPVVAHPDPEVYEALYALVSVWVEQSNGRADFRAVEGTAPEAVAALGVPRAGFARLSPAEGLSWMGWAAASGGAHGRRRGAAAGRNLAWQAAAALTGLDWPVDPDRLGAALTELEWHLWTDGSESGWNLRLTVADPAETLAWAFTATDAL